MRFSSRITPSLKLFGAIPEAFKANPAVNTQCRDPGLPPGTSTMHTSRIDLGKLLVALGYLPPPAANVFLLRPNHCHVLLHWWQVVPVPVLKQNEWPSKDASSGITSYEKRKTAEKAGEALEAPSNFFFYFQPYVTNGMKSLFGYGVTATGSAMAEPVVCAAEPTTQRRIPVRQRSDHDWGALAVQQPSRGPRKLVGANPSCPCYSSNRNRSETASQVAATER